MQDSINAVVSLQSTAFQTELQRILSMVTLSEEQRKQAMDEASANTTFNDKFVAELQDKFKTQAEEAASAIIKKARTAEPPASDSAAAAADIAKAAAIRDRAEAAAKVVNLVG